MFVSQTQPTPRVTRQFPSIPFEPRVGNNCAGVGLVGNVCSLKGAMETHAHAIHALTMVPIRSQPISVRNWTITQRLKEIGRCRAPELVGALLFFKRASLHSEGAAKGDIPHLRGFGVAPRA